MLAHDILLPVNAWGVEAFRDASDIKSMRNPQVRAAIHDMIRFRCGGASTDFASTCSGT
jgi:hypothetical protein